MPKRTPLKLLREREQAAITGQETEPPTQTPAGPAPEKAVPSAESDSRARPAAADATGGRLAVHLPRAEFQEAKGAYLADWRAGGEADTFARWISEAGAAHAGRTPADRAGLALDATPGGDKVTRTFAVPTDVVRRIRAAIATDQDADRWVSESAWMREAIASATSLAKDRSGGVLPTPPARLPNRLIRH